MLQVRNPNPILLHHLPPTLRPSDGLSARITTARHAELERIVVLVVVGARFLPGGWNEV